VGVDVLWLPLPFVAMAETAERVFVNRIGELDSYSLGLVSTKSSGKPRSERQLSCKKILEGSRFRFIFASFVKTENLQLLESTHKMAARPLYGRHDNCRQDLEAACASESPVIPPTAVRAW
jgi:hypothetical protein